MYAGPSPEPADIVWENLTLGLFHKIFFRILTWLVMLALLVGSYFLNFLIYDWKKTAVRDSEGGSIGSQIGGRVIGFVGSYFLILTNFIMQQVAMKLTLFEGHPTITRYGLSTAYKLTLVKVLNIGLIPLVNNLNFDEWFTSYGLIEDTFFNVLFYIIGEVVFTAIDMV